MSAKVEEQHRTAACRWSVPASRRDMLANDDAFESVWLCEREAIPVVTSSAQCRSCANWEVEAGRRAGPRRRLARHRP
jgi:hypothetical protein